MTTSDYAFDIFNLLSLGVKQQSLTISAMIDLLVNNHRL